MKPQIVNMLIVFAPWVCAGCSHFHVWGTIENGDGAKVIVSAWSYGYFDANHYAVGVVADEDGNWEVSGKAPFAIKEMYVSVCTKDGRYGFRQIDNGRVDVSLSTEFWKVFGVQHPSLAWYTYDWVKYETFTGKWIGVEWLKNADCHCEPKAAP